MVGIFNNAIFQSGFFYNKHNSMFSLYTKKKRVAQEVTTPHVLCYSFETFPIKEKKHHQTAEAVGG